MQLTTINPGFVLGAPLDAHFGTSIQVIERLLRGKDPMLPDIGFTKVDEQDVAEMHVTVIDRPETFGQRTMTADSFLTFKDIAQAVKAAFPDRRIPTRVAPNCMIRFLGQFDPTIKSIAPGLGRVDKIDNSRARATIGRGMRQARKPVVSSAKYLIDIELV
ncbi:MAG: dihydroflavonol-4-reductase [Yoonia sp.]|jgi:dihydroflavonol-4-reductase